MPARPLLGLLLLILIRSPVHAQQSAATSAEHSSANRIWNPFASLKVGIQYHYGWKELKDGERGNASHFQISAKYTFIKVDPDKKTIASTNSEPPAKTKG